MEIKTKYDVDDQVVIIIGDEIKYANVKAIQYSKGTIFYNVNPVNFHGRELEGVSRMEINCFKNIGEISERYKRFK